MNLSLTKAQNSNGRMTANRLLESKTPGGFASQGTAVLSSRRLLPDASENQSHAARLILFR